MCVSRQRREGSEKTWCTTALQPASHRTFILLVAQASSLSLMADRREDGSHSLSYSLTPIHSPFCWSHISEGDSGRTTTSVVVSTCRRRRIQSDARMNATHCASSWARLTHSDVCHHSRQNARNSNNDDDDDDDDYVLDVVVWRDRRAMVVHGVTIDVVPKHLWFQQSSRTRAG